MSASDAPRARACFRRHDVPPATKSGPDLFGTEVDRSLRSGRVHPNDRPAPSDDALDLRREQKHVDQQQRLDAPVGERKPGSVGPDPRNDRGSELQHLHREIGSDQIWQLRGDEGVAMPVPDPSSTARPSPKGPPRSRASRITAFRSGRSRVCHSGARRSKSSLTSAARSDVQGAPNATSRVTRRIGWSGSTGLGSSPSRGTTRSSHRTAIARLCHGGPSFSTSEARDQ